MIDFWKTYKTPAGWTATVCYCSKFEYDLENKSEEHYQFAGKDWCSETQLDAPDKPIELTCFHMMGANTFKARGDAGDANLAISRDEKKCEWKDKVLSCRA
ncbi:related to DnaJ-like protein [Sporisorium scitamineum]|uniref:Related to DnaJ-like protein n=1 Tax=Sporisorium scitamineum TaxID=49012 RepID=A0A0F7S7U7_9BASI|nr:related to DnaJ-like protein [Sporisorium scitamineum]CDW96980.1 hypothetical protein [Sporisorium scitamineum]